MRIFYALLILIASIFLWMLPMTEAVYDYKTALRTDTFLTATGVGVTSANETLGEDLYDCDTSSIDIDSDDAGDTPVASTVNCTTRVILVTGLSDNSSRTLEITYAYDALEGYDAIEDLIDRWPFIWIVIILLFGPAALFAIFTGRGGN